MTKQKGILYDFDGTLLDTYDLILASMNQTLQDVLGKTFSEERTMKRCGCPIEIVMEEFTNDPHIINQLVEHYREIMPSLHDDYATDFPGIRNMLSTFKHAQLKQAIVTSKLEKYVKKGLRLFDYERFFDCLVTPEYTKKHKPNPEPVLYGIEKMCLEPATCFYVGDSPYDIHAGNAAGCTTIAVSWGKVFSREQHEAESPNYIVDKPSEIIDIILNA